MGFFQDLKEDLSQAVTELMDEDNEKKEKIITIRVSEEEYDLIIEKAVKLGLSISAYLRMLGLKD